MIAVRDEPWMYPLYLRTRKILVFEHVHAEHGVRATRIPARLAEPLDDRPIGFRLRCLQC